LFGILGGTGFGALAALRNTESERVETRYGTAYLEAGLLAGQPIIFMPRHGHPAMQPPHKVNYRANIQALKQMGVTQILAVTAVGSVAPELEVGDFVVPDQIIDYTSGREHTFFDQEIHHIDFTYPYDAMLRQQIAEVAAVTEGVNCIASGVYGCTNGPRLETAAEVQRLHHDGCTIVGMTAMPEAALAREASLPYAGLSVVVNKGAGLAGELDLEVISASLAKSMAKVVTVIETVVRGT
jgi:5'-methylthioinosine phosphorylase